ncbi:MAG: CoA pyrophosphatase [Bacteroidota bacterium]
MKYDYGLIKGLQQELSKPLPGIQAHLDMAPALYKEFVEHVKTPKNPRLGAILLLLYVHDNKLHIPFMRRTEDGRAHSGQISFPGGRVEETDDSFTHTAVREAHEELGIDPERITIIGELSEVYIIPSNFLVHPRVAFMEGRPDFIPSEEEVAEIIEVELGTFLDPSIVKLKDRKLPNGRTFPTPGYEVREDVTIWGGTSMMMAEFLKIFENIL